MTVDLTLDEDLFEEPEGFRPPAPEPTFETFVREVEGVSKNKVFNVRLVGSHSLWAHVLWNAGVWLAHYFDKKPSIMKHKNVLELGAGAALPSLVAYLNGAKSVVITDYPDSILIDNINYNLEQWGVDHATNINVKGFRWGSDANVLLHLINFAKYDVLILSDLIFNHSQHQALLNTMEQVLADDGIVYCSFSHHRPHLADKDLDFFHLASQQWWECESVGTEEMEPMFEKDPGDQKVRSQVHLWTMRKSKPE